MLFRKAILLIHGFAGGTYDLEVLANSLELNRNFDVYIFTLPGHDVKLRKDSTSKKWIEKSEKMVEMLIANGYKKIYVVGHSMGGVIACYLATKYKEITKLVLAAPAFRYISNENGDFKILDALKKTPDIIKTYSSNEVISRMLKLPLPSIIEFLELVKEHQETPKNISIPTLIIQGNDDQMVPRSSSEYVYNSLKSDRKKLVYFNGVTHDIFRKDRTDEVIKEVESFLKVNLVSSEIETK